MNAQIERRDIQPMRAPSFVRAAMSMVGRDSDALLRAVPGRAVLARPFDIAHFTNQASASALLWQRFSGGAVVTVHDLIPHIARRNRWPEAPTGFVDRLLLWSWIRGLKNAQMLITDSESTRRDLISILGVPSDRTKAIFLGVDHHRFSPGPAVADREALSGLGVDADAPYVLYVGSLHARKNIDTLITAFANARTQIPNLRLVFAGSPRTDEKSVRRLRQLTHELALAQSFQILGSVPENVLASLYRSAAVLVLPSHYEGFGFPALEAMACGCPTICSNVSSLPEVVGDSGILIDPDSPDEIASRITEVCTNTVVANALRDRGISRAATFTWDQTASSTIDVYQEVRERQRASGSGKRNFRNRMR
jgi:glycosyltransferase involved in cell wall biosynthesis